MNRAQVLDAMAAVIMQPILGRRRVKRDGATPAAHQAALDLAKMYEDWNRPLAEMKHVLNERLADQPLDDRRFGRVLALQAMGKIHNDTVESLFTVPSFRVRLDDDELVWEGNVTPTQNGVEEDLGINPSHRRQWMPAMVDDPRAPTDEEIAAAWRYIEREFTLKEGNIDGEQWAEGLAFGRPLGNLKSVDPLHYKELMDAAREFRPQLSESAWQHIAARANYLAREQGEQPRYTGNPQHAWPRSEVQSLLFAVDRFTADQARAWAKQHGFRYGKVDTTEHYHRLRQFDPTGAPCRTIELPGTHPVVKAVICSST